MGGIWNGQDVSRHLWSLSVEQQYYLVWPLIVIVFATRPRLLLGVGVLSTIAALAAFTLEPDGGHYKQMMLFTRGFTLAMASTVAVFAHQRRASAHRWSWGWLAIPGAALVLAAFVLQALNVVTHEEAMANLLPFLSMFFCGGIAWLWYRSLSPRLAPFVKSPLVKSPLVPAVQARRRRCGPR